MQERRDKCVYVHKLNGVVVYVGSGNTNRRNDKTGRSPAHLKIWDDLDREVVISNLTEEDAKSEEQRLINSYWSSQTLLNRTKSVAKTKELDWKLLDGYFKYDENSKSFLSRKVSVRGNRDTCGSLDGSGYYQIGFNYQKYRVHRIIWSIYYKVNLDKSLVIDHIDGNSLNNKISNLRAVSHSDNSKNKLSKPTNTGYKYINENKTKNCFQLQYRENLQQRNEVFSYALAYSSRQVALDAALERRKELSKTGSIELLTPMSTRAGNGMEEGMNSGTGGNTGEAGNASDMNSNNAA